MEMKEIGPRRGRIPGFSQNGVPVQKGRGHQPTIRTNFPENCMKMKKIGTKRGGGRPKFYYVLKTDGKFGQYGQYKHVYSKIIKISQRTRIFKADCHLNVHYVHLKLA